MADVRESMSGVQREQPDTVRLWKLQILFTNLKANARGFQRGVSVVLQKENCFFFFFFRHLARECKVTGWFSLLSAMCTLRCLVNFISVLQAHAM